jgi:hypothetical protein
MPVVLRLLFGLALIAIGPAHAVAQTAVPSERPPASGGDKTRTDGDHDKGQTEDESAPDKGTVIVKATIPTGAAMEATSVTIDGKPMGALEDGEAILLNVPEGRHVLVIEALGCKKSEHVVTVHAGERVTVVARLVVQPPPPRPVVSSIWTVSLAASAAMLAAGGGYGLHSYRQMTRNTDAILVVSAPNPDGSGYWTDPKSIQTADCGKDAATLARLKHAIVVNQQRLDRMCVWRLRVDVSYGIAGLGLIGAFISVVALTREWGVDAPAPPHRPTPPRGMRDTRRRQIAIVPIVAPSGGGALLSVSW